MSKNQKRLVLVTIVALSCGIQSALAQSNSAPSAEAATRALLQMNNAYQRASAAQKPQLLQKFRAIAAQRQQVLSSLIQTNPGEVLRFAIPGDIAGKMPPSVQAMVEQRIQAQGGLSVLFEDSTSGAKLHHYLKSDLGQLALHFAEKVPTYLLSGAVLRINGVRLGGDVALACCSGTSTSSLQVVSAAPLPNTFGGQNTLVILVNFQDVNTQPYTTSTAYGVMFGSGSSVTNFDLQNSLQQTWLTGNVVGWYTLPITSATCDYNSVATYANQAATAAGVNLSSYSRFVYAFPQISSCSWWGLGTIGGSPSQAWINGSVQLKVVAHEMGHNFGLYHAHAYQCGNTQTLCSNPTIIEYGDSIDTMGSPSAGHFNAFEKERLGWLNYGTSPPISLVQSSGTYSIGPYENQDSTSKALKFLKSTDPTTGANTWYYVQFDQAAGFDSFLSNDPNVLGGVLVHIGTDNDGNSNDLLNMAPALNNFYTSALDAGQTFIDPNAGITLQTSSASSSGATVSVVFGTPACSYFNPTVSISPYQSQTVLAGATVSYTVSVTDNDNAGCTATTFNMASSVPSGWSASFANTSLTLSPGGIASTTLQMTSPANGSTGIYSFSASASNSSSSSFTGSASATYVLNTTPCINANPTVTLSPSQSQSVQPGTTITYLLSVTSNDNSSCSSSTFHLSDAVPSGWTAVLGVSSSSLTIAPGGLASTSLNVTSPSTAVGGTYTLTGSATNTTYGSGTYSGTASASYVVAGAGSSCARANPTVTMSPAQSQSVAPGTPVSFGVTVTDNDSSSCGATNFNLNANLLSGWSGSWSSSALSLSPGGSSSATLTVTSPATATTGSYTVSTSATDSSATSYVGSASATYVTSSSTTIGLAISTNSPSYSAGQTVGITVSVTSGGTPVSGASVNVVIASPAGSSTTLTGTTGTNGIVTLSYKLKRQATTGTYQAAASVASKGRAALTVGASTTFLVQ